MQLTEEHENAWHLRDGQTPDFNNARGFGAALLLWRERRASFLEGRRSLWQDTIMTRVR
ncbi:MAG TPA: hypothetical protein VF666_11525 [Pyrinomonadaceae bacterium]|jgi:hypothetical protein